MPISIAMEFFTQLPLFVYLWAGVILLMALFALIYGLVKSRRLKRGVALFKKKNPNAGKIYGMAKGVISSHYVEIHLVDEEAPLPFKESGRSGILLSPGKHKLQISYTNVRPGIIYRSVSKSTGTIDVTVEVAPYTSYDLTFDKKNKEFLFKRIYS